MVTPSGGFPYPLAKFQDFSSTAHCVESEEPMEDLVARFWENYKRASLSRRQLLALGAVAAGAPLVSAFGQGGCRDGYGQGQRCPLSREVATAPIKPVFEPTNWKTLALEQMTFQVADYKKEAAFYIALMGWKLRSDDGKQAIMDIGDWGSCIFKQAPPNTMAPAPAPAAGRGGRGPSRATVQSFGFVIDPWDAKKVEAELRKRGMTPMADHDGKGFESFWVKDPDGWNLQICNGNGLSKVRRNPPTAKLSEPAPFESTGWKTVWLDHFSFGVTNYKESASFYMNLLGWKPTYDEGTQHELMMGDVGDIIVRGGNPNDPNFGKPSARGGRGGRGGGGAEGEAPAPATPGTAPARSVNVGHISFGISPWDVDDVKLQLEKRGLNASIDTSSAHLGPDGKYVSDDIHQAAFQSYHTTTPNGYNLQISWVTHDKRLALPTAVRPKPTGM
jgi:catechol 2,3-dioxygenase-like lactoylglutathione lyase family enzyme